MSLSKRLFKASLRTLKAAHSAAQKERQKQIKKAEMYEAQKKRATQLITDGNSMKTQKSRISRYKQAKKVLINALEIYPEAKDANDVREQIRLIDEMVGKN